MDIYFKGYGFWFTANEPGEPLNQLTPTYLVNGVFRLNDGDAIKFRHTKSIDCIDTLYPSSHKDDEFSKVAKAGSLKGYKPEKCWFSIDPGIDACTGIEKIAVIAEPDSPSGVLVEHVETPIAANKFSIDALIETRIPALFIKAKIDNAPFTQGLYKTLWVKMLEKERDYLSGLDFSDLRESRLQRINAKLKDFQEWANDVGQKATKPASAKVIQANSNEFEFSGLLHQPSGKDDWFEVIDVMTKAFYDEHNAMPTKAQAWTQLCTNSPLRYGIKPDENEQSLTIPGVIKAFNKRSFDRRWAK